MICHFMLLTQKDTERYNSLNLCQGLSAIYIARRGWLFKHSEQNFYYEIDNVLDKVLNLPLCLPFFPLLFSNCLITLV